MPGVGKRPIFGRADEIAGLRAVVDQTLTGAGRLAVVEGEAGIGKSRLLDETLSLAAERGCLVLRGAAEDLERDRPFGCIVQALGLNAADDPNRASIAGLLSGIDPAVGAAIPLGHTPELRYRITEEILALLERMAVERAVVLAFDDLQWADPSSLLTLLQIARRSIFSQVALVAACRPMPRAAELDRVIEGFIGMGGVHMTLAPLDVDAIASIAEHILGVPPGPNLATLLARAGGNPFYIEELLEALRDDGAIEVSDRVADTRRTMVPASLRFVLMRRLSFLSPGCLVILRIASLLGSHFSVTDLSIVSGRSAVDLAPSLQEALAAGIIAASDDRLAFQHDLIRETVYLDAPPAVRAALHDHAGLALAAAGGSALQVAGQLAISARRGDVDAVSWLRRAARETGTRGAGIAVGFLRKALDLLPPDGVERGAVLDELIWGLAWAGDFQGCVELARSALARDGAPELKASAQRAIGWVMFVEARWTEALEQLSSIDASCLPSGERAQLLADIALTLMPAGDLDGAAATAREARDLAEATASLLALAQSHYVLALVADLRGEIQEAIRLAEEAVAAQERDPSGRASLFAAPIALAIAFIHGGRPADATTVLHRGRGVAEDLGIAWVLPMYHCLLAWKHFYAGEWDDAVAESKTSLRLLEEGGGRAGFVLASSILAHVATRRGDSTAASAALAAIDSEVESAGPGQYAIAWAFWARALEAEARGAFDEALTLIGIPCDLTMSLGVLGELREFAADSVRIALEAGDADRARSIVGTMAEVTARARLPVAEAAAIRCRGLLADNFALLSSAASLYEEAARPVDRAATCEEAAGSLVRAGRKEEAVVWYEDALAGYERCGAVLDIGRVEAKLRTVGVRRGRRGPRPRRPERGWESLTATERAVATFAGEGLTNPEIGRRMFISRRTVETHVSHVFSKLGIGSRVELATLVARRSGG